MKFPDDLVEWTFVVAMLSLSVLMWVVISAAITGGLQ
jgi:hypothetical protein